MNKADDSLAGLYLLGYPIHWEDEDADWSLEERITVRSLILPHLKSAVRSAEAYLRQQHKEAEMEDPLEVWQAGVYLSGTQSGGENEIDWEMSIEAHNAGVCPSHFLTFRNGDLIDATAAD